MPKKTPEPEQAPKADNYAKINMPAAFLTPHDIQTSDGRTFEKCFVSFPKGTRSQAMTPPSPPSREPDRILPSSTEERGDSPW